jgi:hypothetical protein
MTENTLAKLQTEYEASMADFDLSPSSIPGLLFEHAAAALIDAQAAENERLQARVRELEAAHITLTKTAERAMAHCTFTVGREPNILIAGDTGVIGLVGETARAFGELQRLLVRIAESVNAAMYERRMHGRSERS